MVRLRRSNRSSEGVSRSNCSSRLRYVFPRVNSSAMTSASRDRKVSIKVTSTPPNHNPRRGAWGGLLVAAIGRLGLLSAGDNGGGCFACVFAAPASLTLRGVTGGVSGSV